MISFHLKLLADPLSSKIRRVNETDFEATALQPGWYYCSTTNRPIWFLERLRCVKLVRALPQLTSIKHRVLLIWQTFSRTRCIAVEPLFRMLGVQWPIARPSLFRLAVKDCLMTRKWREGLFLVENQIMKVMLSDFRTDFELKETTLMAFTELLSSLRYHNFDMICRTFLFFKNWTKRVLAAARECGHHAFSRKKQIEYWYSFVEGNLV